MDQKDARQQQMQADVEVVAISVEIALRRTAYKIAWTRMHGKNDAVNPFCEAGIAPTAATQHADEGLHRRG